jgi:transposase
MAMRRRRSGHAGIEADWVQAIADLVSSGVSVKALAEHLQVSRQTVYDWLEKARSR